MNEKQKNISNIPDPLANDVEKKKKSYGISYAKAIQEEWFNGGGVEQGTLFLKRHDWIRELREFNRGESDIELDQKKIARQAGDLSLLNLNWERVNFSEKFVNIVANGMSDDYYRVDVRSADKFALLEKKKKIIQHKVRMESQKMFQKAKELGMPDLTYKGFVAEDEEELNLYTELKERPAQEIREEILINFVKETSDWDYIKKQSAKDLTEIGISVARCVTDSQNGIQLEYVDPEHYGHSYAERNDFKDVYYHFVIDTITLSDIKRESCGEISDVELLDIYKNCNPDIAAIDLGMFNEEDGYRNKILKEKVHVMRFCFKTKKETVYKKYYDKKGNLRKVAKRDSDYNVPEGSEKSKMSNTKDTWYEGNYIVGSNKYLYGYKESELVARDEMNKVLPPFITRTTNIYKNNLSSFLSVIKPLCDQLQYYHLMIQKLSLELKPDLTIINLDSLAELETNVKGGDKQKSWEQALSILNVKGVVFEQTIDLGEEGVQKAQSAKPQAHSQGSALGVLLNLWAHYYNQIREITGINPARDGSLPADALLGVNKMMQLASNTATKHLVDAAIDFDKRICHTISSRFKGIFKLKNAKNLQKIYERALGRQNIELVDGLKDRHLNDFGFYIEMVPSKEELNELKQSVDISLQDRTIDVSEAAEIMRLAKVNIKQAYEYMRFIRRRKIKEEIKKNEINIKLQGEQNQKAAMAKTQGEIQSYQAKASIDLKAEAQKSAIRIKEAMAMAQIEGQKDSRKFDQQAYLESIKENTAINLSKFKEKAKDDRLDKQSTHQSDLIEQRKNGSGPKDFTETIDTERLLN